MRLFVTQCSILEHKKLFLVPCRKSNNSDKAFEEQNLIRTENLLMKLDAACLKITDWFMKKF